MTKLRPTDLARRHGISTQAVRNYERDGFLPPACRTDSGYRVYTELHAAALRAYLALVTAYGYATAGRIMIAIHDGKSDDMLLTIDRGHHQLLRDRETLDSVRNTVRGLTAEPPSTEDRDPRTIGELANRLKLTPATLRNWEDAGILAPARERGTGYRVFTPADIREAELAHLLRRGGYPLAHIADVVGQIRAAGGTAALATALDDWQRRLTARGLAMLTAAGRLGDYLTTARESPPPSQPT